MKYLAGASSFCVQRAADNFCQTMFIPKGCCSESSTYSSVNMDVMADEFIAYAVLVSEPRLVMATVLVASTTSRSTLIHSRVGVLISSRF